MKTSEVLERAKHQLLMHGWCRLKPGTSEGPNCLLGALNIGSQRDLDSGAYGLIRDMIGGGRSIGAWNDAPRRTVDQVYAVLDKAILHARAREAAE